MLPVGRAMAQAHARSLMDSHVEFLDTAVAETAQIIWEGPASIQSLGMRQAGLKLVPISIQEMAVYVPLSAPASGFEAIVLRSAPDPELFGTRFTVKAIPVDTAAPYRLVIVERAV